MVCFLVSGGVRKIQVDKFTSARHGNRKTSHWWAGVNNTWGKKYSSKNICFQRMHRKIWGQIIYSYFRKRINIQDKYTGQNNAHCMFYESSRRKLWLTVSARFECENPYSETIFRELIISHHEATQSYFVSGYRPDTIKGSKISRALISEP